MKRMRLKRKEWRRVKEGKGEKEIGIQRKKRNKQGKDKKKGKK